MTDEEFDKYLEEALSEVEQKQDYLEKEYGLGHHNKFVVDYETGLLTFFNNEKPMVEASIIPVASHVPEKENLKWAWANSNYPSTVREKSSFTKELYDITGFDLFKNESFECDEEMAWEVNALACKVAQSKGIYRVPHANINVHVIITELRNFG